MDADMIIRDTIKPFFGVQSDEELVNSLSQWAVVYILGSILLLWYPAPYGRYGSKKFGLMLPTKFSWVIQESPSSLVPIWLVITLGGLQRIPQPNFLLLVYFVAHYIYRAFIYPQFFNNAKPTPVLVFLSALIFTMFNGFLQGFSLLKSSNYSEDWIYGAKFFIGSAVFFLGLAANIYHDHLLMNLRKPGEKSYKIPRGGLFRFVSCPNFSAECLEWWGFAIAAASIPAILYAIASSVFLISRALHHHRFYKKKFDNYPKERKAMIPFVL